MPTAVASASAASQALLLRVPRAPLLVLVRLMPASRRPRGFGRIRASLLASKSEVQWCRDHASIRATVATRFVYLYSVWVFA